jgi:hypothetical protein
MAEVFQGIGFDVMRSSAGWYVAIVPPNGARVELHDFPSENSAKIWIKENARNWASDYFKKPSELPVMSNPTVPR